MARVAGAMCFRATTVHKLPISKSEKTNAAWRLVISTGLSLNQLVEASIIPKPTIVLMKRATRHLREADAGIDLDELTWL
jgi:hypothetical protein